MLKKGLWKTAPARLMRALRILLRILVIPLQKVPLPLLMHQQPDNNRPPYGPVQQKGIISLCCCLRFLQAGTPVYLFFRGLRTG